MLRARFLFTLDDELHVDGERAGRFQPGAQRRGVEHDARFVVHGSPAVQTANVVMRVHERGGCGGPGTQPLSHYIRMGAFDAQNFDLGEAASFDEFRDAFGRTFDLRGVETLSRDSGNS